MGAARELARRGQRVILLEARARLGGRIFPVSVRGLKEPVELGAEFIHGNNADFRALARRAGVRLESVSREMYHLQEGRLVQAKDHWKRTTQLLKKLPANTRLPLGRFLKEWARRFPAEDVARVRDHVESFNAAPAGRMSAAALSEDHAGADQSQHRPVGGYLPLVEALGRDLCDLEVAVRLGMPVRRIEWRRGDVTIFAGAARSQGARIFRAKRVVVTLPLGVLKAKSVSFSPSLKSKDAIIRRLGWGDVRRVTLRFTKKFWRKRFVKTGAAAKTPGDCSFVTAHENPFPVWWVPSAEPVIVGWAGGPLAEPLQGLGPARIKMAALRSLAAIWGAPPRVLRTHLLGFWSHDWARDPYSVGAYSYAVAGFETGPAQLARPVQRTLYFAGEAMAEELGTVHGALASGIAAARQLSDDFD